jgi:tetratricopeptide (TPR) repeat protein
MNKRSLDLTFIAIGGLVLTAGVVWLSMGAGGNRRDGLSEARALARAHRFDDAEQVLKRHLQSFPSDPQALLLRAQIATDRADPQPELALDCLARIHPSQNATAALIQFLTGKAEYQRSRFLAAETCWRKALKIDPLVPEAGSALMDLMEVEGRLEEAYELGLELFEREPDRKDRLRFLIELARLDLDRPDPESVARFLDPLAREDPDHLQITASLGLALIHNSRVERGIEVLREMLRRHPDSPEAWAALLRGLDDAAKLDDLTRAFAELPGPLAFDPRFAKFAGMVAQTKQDWRSAATAYEKALEHEPFNEVILYRLSRVQHLLGESSQGDLVDHRLKAYQDSYIALNELIYKTLKSKEVASRPWVEIYERLAALREQMGRFREARAWHELVLLDNPSYAPSLAALERLK